MRPVFSQVQDQLTLLKQQNMPNSWLMVIQDQPESFALAGQGNGGFFEFSPFLLPEITCYIALFIDNSIVKALQFKSQYILIVYSGPKTLIPRANVSQNLTSTTFKSAFQGFSAIVYTDSANSLQNQLKFTMINPSFKCSFHKLSQGFQILSSKEKRVQPYLNSLVHVNCEESQEIFTKVTKQLKRSQTRKSPPPVTPPKKPQTSTRAALINLKPVEISNISISDDENLENFMSSLPQRRKKTQKSAKIPVTAPVTAPVVKREIPVIQPVASTPQPQEKERKTKKKSILEQFNQQFHTIQNLQIDDQKQQQQTQIVLTAIEQFVQSTPGERAERTKQIKQALSRAAMSYVVYLAAQENCLEAKFSDTLQKLKRVVSSEKFELLSKVINSNKSINTEEVCLKEVKQWAEFLK